MTTQVSSELETFIKGGSERAEEVGQETVTNDQPQEQAEVEETAPTAENKEPGQHEKEESWTKKAVLDERRKRQEIEAKLREYESKVNKQEQQIEEGGEQQEIPVSSLILHERINLSRELMIDKHEDYEEMESVFVDMAKDNPMLVHQMNQSANPAKFAYNKAKEHAQYLEYQSIKDTDDFKAFVEARKSGAIQKPQVETESQKRNKSAIKVPDLINATSAKSGHIEGTKDLNQIFGR